MSTLCLCELIEKSEIIKCIGRFVTNKPFYCVCTEKFGKTATFKVLNRYQKPQIMFFISFCYDLKFYEK